MIVVLAISSYLDGDYERMLLLHVTHDQLVNTVVKLLYFTAFLPGGSCCWEFSREVALTSTNS